MGNRYWSMYKLPMFGCTDPAEVVREKVSYSVSNSVSSPLRLWLPFRLPFRNLLHSSSLGPFPVGRGSNAVQAMFISSTHITSVVGLLYNIWTYDNMVNFRCRFVFQPRLECSPSLG